MVVNAYAYKSLYMKDSGVSTGELRTKDFDLASFLNSCEKDSGEGPQVFLKDNETLDSVSAIEKLIMIKEAMEKSFNPATIKQKSDDWREMDEKQWKKLLEKVDAYLETLRESIEAEEARQKADRSALLTARYTTFVRKDGFIDPESGQKVGVEHTYKTFYTREVIICERSSVYSNDRADEECFNWSIDLQDGDYERVMNLLDQIPEGDNTIFTKSEAFWQDFVDGKIDEEDFLEYYNSLDHGILHFIKRDENGNDYFDTSVMETKYAEYFGAHRVTA